MKDPQRYSLLILLIDHFHEYHPVVLPTVQQLNPYLSKRNQITYFDQSQARLEIRRNM
jgi:hypothetical protein